jgi:hypothetical protein
MRREPIANSPAPTRASAAGQRSPASSSCLTSIASSVHLVHGRLTATDGREGDQGQTQRRTAGRSAADSGSPHPCRTYGVAPPAKRPDSTALGHPSLIRMRSQVQVLAGPPPIVPGQSAVGSEPGTLAAGLGRAGAARPSPPAPPVVPPGPPTRAAASATTTHRGRAARGASHSAAAATSALQPASVPTAQPPATGAPSAGLACLVAQWSSAAAAARTQPGPPRSATDLPPANAMSAASPASRPPRPSSSR